MTEVEPGLEYDTVDVTSATVTTAVPYTKGAEYREYTVSGDELPHLLMTMEDPQHSERVVDVELERED